MNSVTRWLLAPGMFALGMACARADGDDLSPMAASGASMDVSQTIGALLEQVGVAMLAHDWEKANAMLKAGLGELGLGQVPPGTLDETGMKLQLAAFEESRGHLSVAAGLRQRVLASRLTLYRQQAGGGY